jgi:hypothetical protein
LGGKNELMPVLREVSELMTRAKDRDEQWFEDWTAARGRLVGAARVALDEPVGQPKATTAGPDAPLEGQAEERGGATQT